MAAEKKPCAGKVVDFLGQEYPCRNFGRYDTDPEGVTHADKRFCHAHSLMGRIHRDARRKRLDAEWDKKIAKLTEIRKREVRCYNLLADVPDEKLNDPKMERVISIAMKMFDQGNL